MQMNEINGTKLLGEKKKKKKPGGYLCLRESSSGAQFPFCSQIILFEPKR